MNKLQTRWDKGVTLIELMIVMVIAAILVGGIYSLFLTQQRSYAVQDQVTGVQQDARAALNIMVRDIRMAGFVTGMPVSIMNSTTGPDSITVSLGTDELGKVTSVEGSVGGSLVTLDPVVSYTGDIAFDLTPGNVYACSPSAGKLFVVALPEGDKPVDGKAYAVQIISYSIVNGVLQRGGQPLAGDGTTTFVEDLQFDQQGRMIRISITVRTAVQDATVQNAGPAAQFTQPALEDHTTNLNGPDGFRRRVYTTEVKVRNL